MTTRMKAVDGLEYLCRAAASGSTVNTLRMNRASCGGRRFGPLNEQRIDVAGVDYLTITVRDLERSVRFYRRIFGCDVIDQGSGGHGLLMNTSGGLYLAIHEWRGALAADAWPPSRWSFVVADLDRVRESVWNLGVATADGTDAPHRVYPWRPERSFVIRDPDGNEIELVELGR